jgi:hypothetical protein
MEPPALGTSALYGRRLRAGRLLVSKLQNREKSSPPSTPLDFLIVKNRKPIHRQNLKFSETETRISIGWCAN